MASPLLAGKRVLVVEDEMMVLMMIEGMLEEMGCQSICAAATVQQALGLLETKTFDVAMLDLNLNGDRSYPIADALDEQAVPFMFSTGYGVAGVSDAYCSRPTLKKPYTFDALALTLEHLLADDRLLPQAA